MGLVHGAFGLNLLKIFFVACTDFTIAGDIGCLQSFPLFVCLEPPDWAGEHTLTNFLGRAISWD